MKNKIELIDNEELDESMPTITIPVTQVLWWERVLHIIGILLFIGVIVATVVWLI